MRVPMTVRWLATIITAVAAATTVGAQQAPAQASLYQRYAPVDLTGTWVSVVSEDWAVRMITPSEGNFESLPLTPAARDAANAVDIAQIEAAGSACDAYGAPAIMREPGRVRIVWEDADTLRIQADAGEQTRLLHFAGAPQEAAASRQGVSQAEWQYAGGFNPDRAARTPAADGTAAGGRGGRGGGRGRGAGAAAPEGGRLKAVTTNLTAGFLRKNGVRHSADTSVTEYYNLLRQPDGAQWLVVTTIVHDPENLVVDYVTSSHFKREADDSKWRPRPCSLR
jgi:hypothetical protein